MLTIPPERLNREMREISAKLGQGLENLLDSDALSSGVSPREAVYREDKLVLYHYRRPAGIEVRHPVPLLIVYALVNRPYMADLQEDRSIIRNLLNAGIDVYLIDWGYPDRADQCLTLEDYIHGYLDRCVDVVRERHRLDRLNVLGICQGGAFSLCYAASKPDKVESLMTMVTPVDFHTPDNLLGHWVREMDVDLIVDTSGNVSGDLLNWMFLSLKPYRLMGQKYLDVVNVLDDKQQAANFLRMEKWIFDSPDQAGAAFRQFIKDFYQRNGLIKGEVVIGDTRIDLSNITIPVLNIYAQQDHLVPPSASIPLKDYVGSKDYQEIAFRGGHIGIYVSGRSQKEVTPAITDWLYEKSGAP